MFIFQFLNDKIYNYVLFDWLFFLAQDLLQFLGYVGFFQCYMPICQFGFGYPTLSFLTTIAGKKLSHSSVQIVALWLALEEYF